MYVVLISLMWRFKYLYLSLEAQPCSSVAWGEDMASGEPVGLEGGEAESRAGGGRLGSTKRPLPIGQSVGFFPGAHANSSPAAKRPQEGLQLEIRLYLRW